MEVSVKEHNTNRKAGTPMLFFTYVGAWALI